MTIGKKELELLKEWVEKTKTESNYLAILPTENYIKQVERKKRKIIKKKGEKIKAYEVLQQQTNSPKER